MRKFVFPTIAFAVLVIFSFTKRDYATGTDQEKYIEEHKAFAIEEMRLFKIPASITLAQAVLESNSGKSELAVYANNHFGIKCHKNWSGKTYSYTDDLPNECFRKYDSTQQSYRDHSKFLSTYTRYAFLFKLEKTDYINWAKGLKKAGYAADPLYAEKLINLIETYNLDELDK